MIKFFAGSSFLAALSGQPAVVTEGQFPVLKTEKSCRLVVPEGQDAAQVYFSKDCATAYVLPPKRIKMRVEEPLVLPGANDYICAAYQKQVRSIDEYVESVKEISTILKQKLAASDSESSGKQLQIRELRKQLRYYEDKVRNISQPYDSMPALRGKVSLSNDVMESIKEFQAANKSMTSEEGAVYPVRFMPAHITDSVVVVSKSDTTANAARTVLKVNFPGYPAPPIAGITNDPDAVYVSMNGGLSGIVDISAAAYCNQIDKSRSVTEIFSNAIAVNLNYKVRVQAGVKVEAIGRIATVDFLRNMQNIVRKGKFDRGEFLSEVLTGGLENSVSIAIDDKGSSYAMADLLSNDEANPERSQLAPLLGRFMLNFVERAESKLEHMGIFTKVEPPRATEVANGEESVKVGENRVCNSKSSWLGLVRSTTCNTYPVYVTVNRDGISELIQNSQDSTYIEERIKYETNETISVSHTSEFVRNQ